MTRRADDYIPLVGPSLTSGGTPLMLGANKSEPSSPLHLERSVAGTPNDASRADEPRWTEQATAIAILRFLLDDGGPIAGPDPSDWESLVRIGTVNGVLLRLADALAQRRIEPPLSFREAVHAERRRVRAMLETAGRVSAICRAHGVEFVVAKAFGQLPDLGADLDVIVLTDPRRFHRLMVDELNATRRKWRLETWLAGRAVYRTSQSPGPIDVHFGRLGQAGEHAAVTRMLVARAETVLVEGIEMKVPAREDRLVLQVMHRLYGHDAMRIGDIVLGARLLGTRGLDWPYLTSTAKREGILDGLRAYVHLVARMYRDLTGRRLEGTEEANGVAEGGWGELRFRGSLYRFPAFRVNANLYARALVHRARRGDWLGTFRVGLIPLVAMARLVRRAHRRAKGSFRGATTLLTGPALGTAECLEVLTLLGPLG